MHILITGGTGFIGSALIPALIEEGHRVTVLTRQARAGSDSVRYVRAIGEIEDAVDGVINLAGASLAGKRWNERYKAEIVDSRISTTKTLGAHFSKQPSKPRWWLNASAIGYYGSRDNETLLEGADPGVGFSAQLCQDWEAAAREACPDGTRLCLLRLGVVLDREGGAYAQMAAPFRMGVANWIGQGNQYLSWVHRADVVGAILLLMGNETVEGPVNVTAPEPVTSKGFCDAMKRQHRTFLNIPMPAPVMRVVVGEMADELLLTGQRVVPGALQEHGFTFQYASIASALAAIEA